MTSPARNWGASDAEVSETYPCDTLVSAPTDRLFRAVTVAADAETVFRWVCEVKVAPYSYDLIDNQGRRSPQELTPGANDLAVGQRFAVVFTIVDYVGGHEITAATTPTGERFFGRVALTYRVRRLENHSSRLIVCLVLPRGSGWRRVRQEARLRRPCDDAPAAPQPEVAGRVDRDTLRLCLSTAGGGPGSAPDPPDLPAQPNETES